MTSSEFETACGWADDRVEALVDGVLPPEEEERLLALVEAEVELREGLAVARRVSRGLHDLPQPACPPEVARSVLSEARRDQRRAAWVHVRETLLSSWNPLWRPAIAVAALVVLVFSSTRIGTPPTERAPTQAEVENAVAQAKWTLAFLSEVGRETGQSVQREVIGRHVVNPMQQALRNAVEPSNIKTN